MAEHSDSRLIDEPFVPYLPTLARDTGSPLRAIILQLIWFRRDKATNRTRLSNEAMSELTAIPTSTLRKHISWLRENGWLEAQRAAHNDATLVWTVTLQPSGQVEVSKSSTSDVSTDSEVSISSTSEVSISSTSISKKEEPLYSPDAAVSPSVGGEPSGNSPLPAVVEQEGDLTSSSGEEVQSATTPKPFPHYEQQTLASWFNVTDGTPWVMAWNTVNATPTTVAYDPQVHLNSYLIRCKDQSQRPRADLWLRWFIEDRDKYARSLAAEEERLANEIDPQEREERDNKRLPPADWGIPTEGENA